MNTKNIVILLAITVAVTAAATVVVMNSMAHDDSGSDSEAADPGYNEVEKQYKLQMYSPTDGNEYSLQFTSDKDGFVRVSFGQGIIGDYLYHKGQNYIHFDQVQRGGNLSFKFFDKN